MHAVLHSAEINDTIHKRFRASHAILHIEKKFSAKKCLYLKVNLLEP